MALYMIGYDLNRPGQNYLGLIRALKGFGTWWHNLDSTWIIKTELSAVQVRDLLLPHMDKTDELLVFRLAPEAAWSGFPSPGSGWLKQQIKSMT